MPRSRLALLMWGLLLRISLADLDCPGRRGKNTGWIKRKAQDMDTAFRISEGKCGADAQTKAEEMCGIAEQGGEDTVGCVCEASVAHEPRLVGCAVADKTVQCYATARTISKYNDKANKDDCYAVCEFKTTATVSAQGCAEKNRIPTLEDRVRLGNSYQGPKIVEVPTGTGLNKAGSIIYQVKLEHYPADKVTAEIAAGLITIKRSKDKELAVAVPNKELKGKRYALRTSPKVCNDQDLKAACGITGDYPVQEVDCLCPNTRHPQEQCEAGKVKIKFVAVANEVYDGGYVHGDQHGSADTNRCNAMCYWTHESGDDIKQLFCKREKRASIYEGKFDWETAADLSTDLEALANDLAMMRTRLL